MDKYFKAIDRDKWVRNPQWPAIPADDGTGTKAYGVFAVFEDEFNGVAVTMTSDSTVDWGDGTSDTYTSTSDISHIYDYATISAPVLTYHDGRNYKPILVEFTSPVTNIHRLWVDRSTSDFEYNVVNWLDIVSYLGDGSTDFSEGANSYLMSNVKKSIYLERFKSKHPQSSGSANRLFSKCINLQEVDVPDDFFNYSNNISNTFQECGKKLKIKAHINNSVDTSIVSLFANSRDIELRDITLNGDTNLSAIGIHSIVNGIGNFTALLNTNGNYMFGSAVTTGISEIGIIDMPLLENCDNMFRGCGVPEVVFTDCSNVNSTTNMFLDVITLVKLIMPGLTVGVSINGNQMTADALDDFMTSVGTADGSQTLDLRNNPGSATCDVSIATNKNFTVLT